jgi:3-oxoacyl-[acyl-carrier protein] reductase/pteridine reductase
MEETEAEARRSMEQTGRTKERTGDRPTGARPLAGKTVLVTGAARRIGRTIALKLAAAGANVAITFRDSQPDAERTVRDLAALDIDAFAARCDLNDPESVHEAVAAVVEEFGRLDILVNNAGLFESARLEDISIAQWDRMFAANTRGPFLMAQAAYPHLRAARGRIVNIGSLGGIHPWATHAHYCTSKAALHMLSQTMAKAWAPEISANCVAPLRGEDAHAPQWHRRRCRRSRPVLCHRPTLHHRAVACGRRRAGALEHFSYSCGADRSEKCRFSWEKTAQSFITRFAPIGEML